MATEELALAIFPRSDDVFERIVDTHSRMVLRTAYRLLGNLPDAQDAAQEVFLRLLKHHKRIDGDAKAWLYRVTVNVCNDHFRRSAPVVEPDERMVDPAPGAERIFGLNERRLLLMEALGALGERERAAVVLRDIEGLTTREVSEILGVEEATVRSQISIARVKLAKYVRSRK